MQIKKLCPTEEEEQITFVEWLRAKNLKHSAIPNSTWTPSISQKMKNKRMGLCAGLPDLLVYIAKEQCKLNKAVLLFIEMKRLKLSKTYDSQLNWQSRLNKVENVQAQICKGCDEAIDFVERFVF